jgi:hypothetical protein
MKIIFLDIDGVLNCEDAYHNGECYDHDKYGSSFYSKSVILLNKLIIDTGANIVISSTWRHNGLDEMKNMWMYRGMQGKIIGITPSLHIKDCHHSVPRGFEIQEFLSTEFGFYHCNWSEEEQLKVIKKSGIENYIIIDDDSDMLYNQRNHFIHVLPSPRNKSGFNEHYASSSLSTLEKNIISINFNPS